MPRFKRNRFRADLREMARSCSNYNKSTNCTNMPKTVRLKCSTEVGYGHNKPRSPSKLFNYFTIKSLIMQEFSAISTTNFLM